MMNTWTPEEQDRIEEAILAVVDVVNQDLRAEMEGRKKIIEAMKEMITAAGYDENDFKSGYVPVLEDSYPEQIFTEQKGE